jgi:hypothetical protein
MPAKQQDACVFRPTGLGLVFQAGCRIPAMPAMDLHGSSISSLL